MTALPSHLLPLVMLQEQTVPVEVQLGPGAVLVLHARTQRRTVQGKRDEARLLKELGATVEAKSDALAALETRRASLLKPFAEKLTHQAELTENLKAAPDTKARQIAQAELDALVKDFNASQDEQEAALVEVREQIDAAQAELEETAHAANAQQLAFYVKRMDLADDEGNEIPPSADFFRETLSFPLLEQCLGATLEALSTQNPSRTPAATEG